MPQTSKIYASARITARQNALLDEEQYMRLLSAPDDSSVMKMLTEWGYASKDGREVSIHEYESILGYSLQELFEFTKQTTPEPAAAEAFLMPFEYHNAKALVKAQLIGADPAGMVYGTVLTNIDTLENAVSTHDYSALRKHMREALIRIDGIFSAKADVQASDIILDKAMYDDIFDTLSAAALKPLRDYYRVKADYANICLFVRAHAMNDIEILKRCALPYGTISIKSFEDAFTQSIDEFMLKFKGKRYEHVVTEGLCYYSQRGITTVLESLAENDLSQYLRERKGDVFSIWPLLWYINAKLSEISTIRLIISARLNNLDKDIILERLKQK